MRRLSRDGYGRRGLALALAGVALLLAGSVYLLTRAASAPSEPDDEGAARTAAALLAAAENARTAAAAWVSANVAHETVVACDTATCAALAQRGYPPGALVRINWSNGDIRRGDLAVVTDTVRARFGTGLSAMLSPQRLAVFGTGPGSVEVARVVLVNEEAHARQLAKDRADRQSAARQLLSNPQLTVTDTARRQLDSGLVDARPLTTLAPLLAAHRVEVSGFAGTPEEATLGVPLRWMDITRVDGVPVSQDAPGTRGVIAFVQAQRPPYGPGRAELLRPTGAPVPVLRVTYPAPGPIGLMSRR